MADDHIQTHLPLLAHHEDLVGEMLKTAQANDCGTVVVGRSSYSWIREFLHTHVSEQLISDSNKLAICIVNEIAPS